MGSLLKTPKIPDPPPPTPLPDPMGIQALQARRRRIESGSSRGGRDSTILGSAREAYGNYSGSALGGSGPA